jgi:hypothetical protein
MPPQERKVTTYNFSELSEVAQEQVIDSYRRDFDFSLYQDDILDDIKEKYSHIEDMEISYSGFWSQGDGASFTGWLDLDWLLTKSGFLTEEQLELVRDVDCTFVRSNSRYVHSSTCHTELEVTEFAEHIQDNDYLIVKLIAPIEEYLQDVVEDYRQEVCYEIYSALEKEYEYLTSHEAIREWADEQEFLENGEIF